MKKEEVFASSFLVLRRGFEKKNAIMITVEKGMTILGIDPGLASIGWAVLEKSSETKLLDYGCIKTSKDEDFSQRLELIFSQIKTLARKYDLRVLAVEELYFAKNVKTAIKVAQCLGVIKLAGRELGLTVVEYTPLNVKMTITGYGRAEKKQIEYMINQTLKLKKKITPHHAADAVAVALTHVFTSGKLKF